MDNITHSLVGVALADITMGRRGTKSQRPLMVGAGIIAANLPDIDVAYSWITPAPLGYLLHHRGHTHTVLGLAALAVLLAVTYRILPSVRKMGGGAQLRFWLLIAIALASHLALDALNSYGVHPFYPADNSWYFGDTLFILEPSLWVILGIAVAWNGRTRTARAAAALPVVVLLCVLAFIGAMPAESATAVALTGGVFAWAARRLSPAARAVTALAILVLIVVGFGGASRIARRASVDALQSELRGEVVDVILTPNPSSPSCWAVIVVELREGDGVYVLWRGTLSIAADWKAPTACASHQLDAPRDVRILGNGRFALRDATRQPLRQLRALAAGNCWARAWLRFGRAPMIEGGSLFDLRFAERPGREFTAMPVARRETCPPYVPGWSMPRADLLR